MSAYSFQDLRAWQIAMEIVEAVYAETAFWPKEEVYGLISQIRRAAVSIPSNIAEGHGRRSKRDFLRYLWIAHASLRELQTQILIAERLKYLPQTRSRTLIDKSDEAGRVITGLCAAVQSGLAASR